VVSGEYFNQEGIDVNDPSERKWFDMVAGATPKLGVSLSVASGDDPAARPSRAVVVVYAA
jgi:hypothetical protein